MILFDCVARYQHLLPVYHEDALRSRTCDAVIYDCCVYRMLPAKRYVGLQVVKNVVLLDECARTLCDENTLAQVPIYLVPEDKWMSPILNHNPTFPIEHYLFIVRYFNFVEAP